MSAPLKAVDGSADLQAMMAELGKRARAAARVLALAPADQKNQAREAMERAVRANAGLILGANAVGVAEARAAGAARAFLDGLALTPARTKVMAAATAS